MSDEPAPAPETPEKKTGCFKLFIDVFLELLQLLALTIVWLFGGVCFAAFTIYPIWTFACFMVVGVAWYVLVKGSANNWGGDRLRHICVAVIVTAFAGIV